MDEINKNGRFIDKVPYIGELKFYDKDGKPLDTDKTIKELWGILERRFEKLESTIVPLARYTVSDMPSFVIPFALGYIAGSMFSTEGITIEYKKKRMDDEEIKDSSPYKNYLEFLVRAMRSDGYPEGMNEK